MEVIARLGASVPLTKHPGDQKKVIEVGRACGTFEEEERCIVFWWGNLKDIDHLEDLGVDGRIILKLI
jgi:hypothetical protein